MATWNTPLPDAAVEGELTHIEDHDKIVAAIEEVRTNLDAVESEVQGGEGQDPTPLSDTGWRRMHTMKGSSTGAATVDMKRIGMRVYSRIESTGEWPAGNYSGSLAWNLAADGFRPDMTPHDNRFADSRGIYANVGNAMPSTIGTIGVLYHSTPLLVVTFTITSLTSRVWQVTLSWLTAEPWPTTLPGAAI